MMDDRNFLNKQYHFSAYKVLLYLLHFLIDDAWLST